MDKRDLNEWAARFIGEPEEMIGTEDYTDSPGAAFVVLAKMIEDGQSVSITSDEGDVSVTVGSHRETGTKDELALLMVSAAYLAANG